MSKKQQLLEAPEGVSSERPVKSKVDLRTLERYLEVACQAQSDPAKSRAAEATYKLVHAACMLHFSEHVSCDANSYEAQVARDMAQIVDDMIARLEACKRAILVWGTQDR